MLEDSAVALPPTIRKRQDESLSSLQRLSRNKQAQTKISTNVAQTLMLERLRTSTAGARLTAAGSLAGTSVTLGGLTLGFFLWYELISHSGTLLVINDVVLLLCAALGVAIAFFGWYRYSVSLAERSPLPLRSILQIDAWSWLGLLVFWVGFFSNLGAEWARLSVAIGIGLFALAKLLTAAIANYTVREVSSTFLLTRVPLIVIAELAATIIGQRAGTHISVSSNPILAVWGRWDAVHYVDIATTGYFGTDMAFFPLYPLLIAALGRLVGNHVFAGLLLSNIALFFGLLFLFRLVEVSHDRRVAHRAIFYISIFPTAIFFSAVYTEALFFALTVSAFYYIRARKWIIAGCIGCCAALTRVEGILLVAPILIEAFSRDCKERDRQLAFIAAAITSCGLALYMAYLWALQGDPLFFSHVQINWGRHLAPPWTSISHSLTTITTATIPSEIANQSLELAFTFFMVTVLIAGLREMRPSFAAYTALSILVPMCTSSLMSMPRFALVLFPLFIVMAHWGRRPTINNAIVSFSLPLLGLFTVLFADWYWVA